ncbi:hypothetical protein H2248_010096 [Termitomyces sp. 'cryptogamus']|nr:hypothetical protein H2248_010096 [Termitomyces sp. 'cryptogamus']
MSDPELFLFRGKRMIVGYSALETACTVITSACLAYCLHRMRSGCKRSERVINRLVVYRQAHSTTLRWKAHR